MIRRNVRKVQGGFTLIEILVVIGIIAILATIVIIAINPAKQFAQARNSQRIANINAILNAVGQRIADNKGVFEGTFAVGGDTYTCGPIETSTTSVDTTMAADTTTETGDLGCLTPTYIPALPSDPSKTTATADTEYEIIKHDNGRITICAPNAADEDAVPDAEDICVTR